MSFRATPGCSRLNDPPNPQHIRFSASSTTVSPITCSIRYRDSGPSPSAFSPWQESW